MNTKSARDKREVDNLFRENVGEFTNTIVIIVSGEGRVGSVVKLINETIAVIFVA